MNKEHFLPLIEKALAQLAGDEPEMIATDSYSDTRRYIDPARFELEKQKLFKRMPNYIGHISELPQAGSYIHRDIAGVSVLVVRDDAGEIRAFVNACRHRGTQLVADDAGCVRKLICPYHAWTYNCDGTLAGVPAEFGFPSLNREDSGLIQLPLWQRSGLLWVLPTIDEAFDFDAFWAPIADDIAALGLDDALLYQADSRQWAANWKLVSEGGLESYHFKKTHAKTIAPYFLSNRPIFDALGTHARLLLPRSNFAELAELPAAERTLSGYAHVVYSLLPNLILLVQEDHTALIQATPRAFNKTDINLGLLIPKHEYESKPESHWALNRQITETTLSEDFEIGEAIQRGIAGGHIEHLHFGRFEHGLVALNRAIDSLFD